MTTSGQTILELSRDDIISAALRKAQVLAKGQTPDAEDLTNASQALNNLVAEFRTLGMPLWARRQQNLTLVAGTSSYTIGVGQSTNTPYPLKLHQVILRDNTSESQIDVDILSVYDFNLLPQQTAGTGEPVNVTYQPFVNSGVLRVWPTPDTVTAATKTLILVYTRPFEYFTAGTDTPDFPEEWKNALIYNLALLLADEYGTPLNDKSWLEKQAQKHLTTALDAGTEDGSLFFTVAWRGY